MPAGGHNRHRLEGKRFGRWIVISDTLCKGASKWLCKCDCGTERIVRGECLTRGDSKSCGCLIREITSKRATTHGMAIHGKRAPEYGAWQNMKNRCYNENCVQYKDWGGRGITVCDRWMESFENFIEDMGNRPSKKHSLHRIENDKGYYKENCMWAIKFIQDRERRSNVWIEYNGVKMILKDWVGFFGVNEGQFYRNFKNGMTYYETVELLSKKQAIN